MSLLWLLGACTPHLEIYPRLEGLARNGQYAEAAKLTEENKERYSERNQVLYNMDRGLFYHYAGQYEQSNLALEAAERRIDELFAESISGNILAFGTNDNTLPYKGEDFEAVVINIYRALNYFMLGQLDEALVEARKVDLKLDTINRQYAAEFGDDKLNEYREDAFARMLMGIFYEAGGSPDDLNDAYISNRLAAGIYQKAFTPNYGTVAPEPLKINLLSSATFMGDEEVERARTTYPAIKIIPWQEKRARAQVVVIHFAGLSPVKVENSVNIFVGGNLIRVAFPEYRNRYYLIGGSRLVVEGQSPVPLQVGHPLGAIAQENLKNRRGRFITKAALRSGTKFLAGLALQREARKRSELAGFMAWAATNVYNAVSEQADLRAWRMLPDQILIGQMVLEPGTHRVSVQFTTSGGGVVSTRQLGEMTLRAGETRVVILHTST